MSSGLYNEGLFREGLLRTTNLVRPGLITQFDTLEEALTRFAVNGVEAALALDFIGSEYRTGNTETTFADAFTGNSPKLTYDPGSASSSQSTMVNSSGNIVWAPHNLADYSEDFSQWSGNVGVTLVSSTATDPLGGSTAYTYSGFSVGSNSRLSEVFVAARNFKCTFAIWLKGTAGETIELELDTDGAAENEITFTGSWQLETISNDNPTTGRVRIINRSNSADVVSVWGAHVYRSDLGGVAPVPGAATGFETYVPTNGAVEYLPRVGHHVYNGSTWVNEGLLIESEPRTNLFPVSTITAVGGGTDWDGAGSGVGSSVSVAAGVIAPDGTAGNVGNYVANAGATEAYFSKDLPVTSGVTYTQSVYAKPNGTNFIQIASSTGFTSAHYNFDLVNLQTSSSDASIEDVGNRWVRCSVTVPCTSTTSVGRMVFAWINSFTAPRLDSDAGGAPNGTDGVYLYGAQLEEASTPSSYIPTSGSTVTRGGQTLTVPPAEFGWPEPEYIGPELVDNGKFETDILNWSAVGGGASVAWDSGPQRMQVTAGAGFEGALQTLSLTSGKVYVLSCDYVRGSVSQVRLAAQGFSGQPAATGTAASGSLEVIAVAGVTNNVRVDSGGSTGDFYVDNISVREINPLSVSIQMDGRMTYADDDATGWDSVVPWQWYIDGNNQIFSAIRTHSTRTGEPFWHQEENNVKSEESGAASTYTPGINVPFNIASRHGSTFIDGAVDGVAQTGGTTPTALPDLSNTNLQIAQDFMGTIGQFRQFAGDIGDAGLEEASLTPYGTDFVMTITTTGAGETFTIPCQNVGTFDASIDWGDGSFSGITAYDDAGLAHPFASAGDHTIRISGSFPNIYFNNGGDRLKVTRVDNFGDVGWAQLNRAFFGCSNMTSFASGSTDTSAVTGMDFMFRDCTSLTSLDVSGFDTSSVTNMSYMFYACSSLTSLDVSGFDTSSVTLMSNVFQNCTSLTSLDVSGFDTSSVTRMNSMFINCTSLTSLDVSGFDTSSVALMSNVFQNCTSLTSLDVSGFDTSSVTRMNSMFQSCSSLTSLDVSGFDTSSVTNMSTMFYICSSLTSLDVSGFDTSSVTNMSYMFYNSSSLTSLDVSGFDTSSVTGMPNMFRDCSSLTSLDVSGFDTSAVTGMDFMFRDCTSLTSLDVSGFDTSSVTNMTSIFQNCSSLTSLDVSGFDTSSVTNMSYMFRDCSSLTSLDVSGFDTSSVTDMSNMLFNCSSLTDVIGVENFDIEGLNSNDDLVSFMTGVTLPTSRYDALLVNWDAQEPVNNMSTNFGNSKYTASSAASAARANLILNDDWSIVDGGTA